MKKRCRGKTRRGSRCKRKIRGVYKKAYAYCSDHRRLNKELELGIGKLKTYVGSIDHLLENLEDGSSVWNVEAIEEGLKCER